MLEILLLVWLCSSLGKILRSKGRKPLFFQIMLVLSWFGAEFVGGVVGGIMQAVRHGGGGPGGFDFTIYICALVGAACAAAFWFLIANILPPVEPAWKNTQSKGDPVIGLPPEMAAPSDPNNPYAPPRTDQ